MYFMRLMLFPPIKSCFQWPERVISLQLFFRGLSSCFYLMMHTSVWKSFVMFLINILHSGIPYQDITNIMLCISVCTMNSEQRYGQLNGTANVFLVDLDTCKERCKDNKLCIGISYSENYHCLVHIEQGKLVAADPGKDSIYITKECYGAQLTEFTSYT